MKTTCTFVVAILAIISCPIAAQTTLPKTSNNGGFWVVETNTKNLAHSTVYCYNEKKQMIYFETVDGTIINAANRSDIRKLNRVLEASLKLWNTDSILIINRGFAAKQFKVAALADSTVAIRHLQYKGYYEAVLP